MGLIICVHLVSYDRGEAFKLSRAALFTTLSCGFRSLKRHMAHHKGSKRVEELTENEIRKIMSRVITKVRIKSWIFFHG